MKPEFIRSGGCDCTNEFNNGEVGHVVGIGESNRKGVAIELCKLKRVWCSKAAAKRQSGFWRLIDAFRCLALLLYPARPQSPMGVASRPGGKLAKVRSLFLVVISLLKCTSRVMEYPAIIGFGSTIDLVLITFDLLKLSSLCVL